MQIGWTRKNVLAILLLIVISRAVMLFTGYLGMNIFASNVKPPVYEKSVGSPFGLEMKLPQSVKDTRLPDVSTFNKFDSFAYISIAIEGYSNYRMDEPHTPGNWVFFPLYPLLIKGTHNFFLALFGHLDPVITGLILSNLFLLAAFLLIYRYCLLQKLDTAEARAVLILMLLYPTSQYYSLPYTESLFLMLSAASICFATEKRYAWAILAASLSTVTRVPGFLNLFFVMGTLVLDERFRVTKRLLLTGMYSLLSVVPMFMYLAYMKWLTGDFLAPFHEQSLSWYRYTAVPFANYVNYFKHPYFISPGGWDNGLISFIVSTIVFLVFIAYLAVYWKCFRDPKHILFFLYGMLLIVVPFSSQPWSLASVIRYMMVSLPFYIYLVRLTQRSVQLRFAVYLFFVSINTIVTIGMFNDYFFMA